MNKRALHHAHVKLRPLRSRYLLLAFVVFVSISIYALRQNNFTAIRLRDEVLKVDQQNGDIEKALRKLREHIYAHMNTDLASGPNAIRPSIQLKYRYERLVAAEKARVSKVNEKIYADAQAICEQRFPVGLSGSGRIPCIENYVAQSGIKEQPIQDSLYKFEFASPRWSPDLAGISLLISAVLLLIIIVRLILGYWLRRQLHDHL